MASPEKDLERVRSALREGRADEARTLVDEAFRAAPEDPEVRDLFAGLHLAFAIRLATEAREARRRDIVRRNIPYDTEFRDAPEVAAAFDRAAASIDEVLVVRPLDAKALMMKASLAFRRDRERGRPVALEILSGIAEREPGNRQVAFTIRKIQVPCTGCGDSGFCPRCRGRGNRRSLGFERECDACHGQGICLVCGVL